MKRAILTASIAALLIMTASCTRPFFVRPPAPKPRAEHRVFMPEVRRITTGGGCSLGDFGGPWDNVHKFPRIIATNGDYRVADSNSGNLDAIARYDGVLWTLDWPTYQNYGSPPLITSPFAYVRNLNSATKFIGVTHSYGISPSYCHIDETYPHRCDIVTAQETADGHTVSGDGWYAKDSNGTPLTFTASKHVNWSALDPSNTTSWATWLGNYIVNSVWDDQCSGSRCWDGFYVESMDIPHPLGNFARIDANENGVTDLSEGTWDKCAVDAHQMDGYNTFFDILAAGGIDVAGGEGATDAGLSGENSDSYLLGHATAGFNGDFPSSTWADCSVDPHSYGGGYTVPGGNRWHYNMRQAIEWENSDALVVLMEGEDLNRDPYYSFYVQNELQQKRLVVGSTLLINAYSVPHQNQMPPEYPCDECLVNNSGESTTAIANGGWLGCPITDAWNTTDGRTLRDVLAAGGLLSEKVWFRAFENGLVVVNASESDKTVSVGTGWKRIRTTNLAGDRAHNDGTAVSGGNLNILAYDAYVLVRDTAPTPTPNPSSTPTLTPTASPSPTPTSTATPRLSPTPTSTATPRLSATPTSTATPSPSPTTTSTATPRPSPTATATATHVPSSTPSSTATPSPSPTPTSTATLSPSPTLTSTATPSPSPTPTFAATLSPSPTLTSTATPSPSPTSTFAAMPRPSPTPTFTATSSP